MTKKNGDWTIKQTKKVFENGFFSVFDDEVIQPDGKEGSYATIDFKPGAAVLPIDEEENIYLTRQFRYALGRIDLEVAAGVIEDESPLEAAQREALEELGIEAEEWQDLGLIEENTSITRSRIYLYAARNLTYKKPKPEGTEEIEVIKMPLKEGIEKVMSGEIMHDLTCLLILKTSLSRRAE